MRMSRVLFPAFFALALFAATPSARACHGLSETAGTVGCFSTLYLGLASLTLGAAEVVYASDAEGVSDTWLWAQVLGAGLPVVLGGAATLASLATGHPDAELTLVWGSGLMLTGGLLMLQGLLRLRHRTRAREPAARTRDVRFGLAPAPGGGVASLSARF